MMAVRLQVGIGFLAERQQVVGGGKFGFIPGQKKIHTDVREGPGIASEIGVKQTSDLSKGRILVGTFINDPVQADSFLNAGNEIVLRTPFYKIADHIAGKQSRMAEREIGVSQKVHR